MTTSNLFAYYTLESQNQYLIHASEPIMQRANLDLEAIKMRFFYERCSGNNWYKGKHYKKTKITIQNKQITVSKHYKPYKYLRKSISINGEDQCQVKEIISTYKDIVEKICVCQLPLTFKVCALNNMALLKVLHYFLTHIFKTT